MAFVTRFAPSPTGPLHLGHAYSAILAHDMARAAGGRFLLRMEDTDLDRCRAEYDALIQEDLAWLGLTWDGAIHRQSEHIPQYNIRLETLEEKGLLYPCSCTRADIRAALSAPQEGVAFAVYPGTCRGRGMASRLPGDALRLNLAAALAFLAAEPPPAGRLPPPAWRRAGEGGPPPDIPRLAFVETGPAHAGRHIVDSARALRQIGDVVLSRKGEDIVAYFLASAFDDADQGITHVVRGEDLFDFTPVQVILQHLFGLPTPLYHHHRLIRDDRGKRLAKRDDARAIAKYRAEGATPADIRRMVGLPAP
ncbi:tRNA glutamyl-Q(34) synthetase GluQRS [Tabrizicola soli]|uniref:tRNA glutamyl-Q(34) synthetase GluQRS n=1 Tax=Tabrizicola soli TaxID=2185115 RepID=A0ABV7DVU7_9RHOB|nr:tRNA glutamyl-Q(34) synthetase GluQRS [Tabrizicola soli]